MSKIPKHPFILVDGSSYLFRAYHALPPLTTAKGQPTGAIFGVVNMIRKLITDYKPENMIVIFDSKEKNFRHELYKEYKANRIIMPDELQSQIAPLHAIIEAMGLPLVVTPGVEADDIIATLAKEAKKKGHFTLISTGDKDFAQIVDDETLLINTMSQVIYDRNKVIEKFGVPPEKIIDYLALIGDTVDNIPGIPKVGPKTAVKWLETYGSLDAIVKHADDISGKVGEYLREHLDKLPLYKELVTIQSNVKLPYHFNDFILKDPNLDKLRNLFTELEFKSWLKTLNEGVTLKPHQPLSKTINVENAANIPSTVSAENTAAIAYECVLTEEKFNQWLKHLKNSKVFAFDTETNSLDYMKAEVVGVAFALEEGKAAYVPFAHDYQDAPKQLKREWVLSQLKPLLEDPKLLKIGHGLKYDIEVLANHGIEMQGIAFDTMLESYVLDSTGSRHNLDALAEKFLSLTTIRYEDVAGKGAKQIPFNQVPLESATAYAAEDADVTMRLHNCFWSRLESTGRLKSVFETIEIPLVPVLARMERIGVLVDPGLLKKQSKELSKRLLELEQEAYGLAEEEFNLNSPKQLQEVLYTSLKLPVLEKTPTGQPSTAEHVLVELAEDYPLPKVIMEYRSLNKLKTTYADTLPEQVDPKTGRIHTSYHQAVTSTGRLSSTNPNLQNIPIRTPEGRKIRSAFIAAPGYKIVAFDYSQIELRIMAHMSNDKGLLTAFTQNDDIHVSTAAAVFGVPLDKVDNEQRRRAKAINFGLMYGMSAFGVAKQLGIERGEAERQIERYFSCFPGVKLFMESIKSQAMQQGFVETLMGRRLYLPNLQSRNMPIRRAAERAAVNAPMQGTNADIIKLAMIELDKRISKGKDDIRMIMQVHDELVFEIREDKLDESIKEIQHIMENVVPLSVKLHVGVGVGDNWDTAH